jgi:tetratricopeptide (TPR) repeat protein
MSEDVKVLQERGVKLYEQREYDSAVKIFQQAQEGYENANQPDMVAEMKTNIGLAYRGLGHHQLALDIMQSALHTFQELKDSRRAAAVLGNMGGVYLEMGDKEQAYVCYRQAADAFLEIGETKMYGETLLAIARMQFKDGKVWTSASTYEIGLENIDKLSLGQKFLKRLFSVKNRLSGTGTN